MTSKIMSGRHINCIFHPIAAQSDIQQSFQNLEELSPKGVKVAIESGILFSIWPTFDEALLLELKNYSEKISIGFLYIVSKMRPI